MRKVFPYLRSKGIVFVRYSSGAPPVYLLENYRIPPKVWQKLYNHVHLLHRVCVSVRPYTERYSVVIIIIFLKTLHDYE